MYTFNFVVWSPYFCALLRTFKSRREIGFISKFSSKEGRFLNFCGIGFKEQIKKTNDSRARSENNISINNLHIYM